MTLEDRRRFAPAAERNLQPILEVLQRVLPSAGLLLEVASGTGQHALGFAAALPGLSVQPSDLDEENLASIAAWQAHEARRDVLPPVRLDVRAAVWPVEGADAIFCANMIHIAPWAACLGLLAGASRLLPGDGPLVLYGPYKRGGQHTAPSNEAFDASLRERDAAWGVRDLEEVVAEAASQGLALDEVVAMPANNLSVVLRRKPC
jgi:hypothetical protein